MCLFLLYILCIYFFNANQSSNLKKQLDESVSKIRAEIIDTLQCENKKLTDKIVVLEGKLIAMEKKVETNLQYQRGSSIVISGCNIWYSNYHYSYRT